LDLNKDIFRQYDIRGIVGQDLTPETVELLGKGIGTYFRQRGRRDVALGRDGRLSSPQFAISFTEGLKSTGCNVFDLGTIPTPLLYFSIYYKNYKAGVMITGSHNHTLIQSGQFIEESGASVTPYDIAPEYKDYVLNNISLQKKLKIVVDAGNGTAGVIAVPIFKKLGCDVIELYCDVDGNFPNHHPDPTVPEALEDLIQKVADEKADMGFAYDGDGDRIGVIDNKGQIIWGDKLLIVFARDILAHHPGATIISEVKASKLLYDEIENLGGRPIMWKTGHSFIKKKIKEEKALLAGEMSGHIFFADRFFGFDDAIYASARLLELISRSEKDLSQSLADLPETFSTPEIRVYASDQVKFTIVDEVKKVLAQKYPIIDIDGVRAIYPNGWALVRPSNTQEILVLRFEADSKNALRTIRSEVEKIRIPVLAFKPGENTQTISPHYQRKINDRRDCPAPDPSFP
jgi:phosphomannomutase/phosphoglucomutase